MMSNLLFIFLSVVPFGYDLSAQVIDHHLSVSAGATYGLYDGSTQRDKIVSESVSIAYIPLPTAGLNLALHQSSLTGISPFPNITGNTVNLSYYEFMTTGSGNYIGGKGALHYITSDDANSDGTLIPHLSLVYKPASLLSAYEIGVARTVYQDTPAEQVSVMAATSLFNQWVWSQTRVTYIDLRNGVADKVHTLAIEERLSYYAIPQKLTVSLYALLGERIYAYDFDLGTAYNLPDMQKGSIGLSLNYNLKNEMSVYTDLTQERYFKLDIRDEYLVQHLTLGVSARF